MWRNQAGLTKYPPWFAHTYQQCVWWNGLEAFKVKGNSLLIVTIYSFRQMGRSLQHARVAKRENNGAKQLKQWEEVLPQMPEVREKLYQSSLGERTKNPLPLISYFSACKIVLSHQKSPWLRYYWRCVGQLRYCVLLGSALWHFSFFFQNVFLPIHQPVHPAIYFSVHPAALVVLGGFIRKTIINVVMLF